MKQMLFSIAGAMVASAVQAAVIVDDDFSTYADGDINGQGDWATSTNNAFVISGDEMTMAIDGGVLLLGGLNSMELQPGDSVTMTINHRYSIGSTYADANWGAWQFGIQNNDVPGGAGQTATGWVHWNGTASGTMRYFPKTDLWWDGGVFAGASAFSEMGCDPGGHDGPIEADSDSLQTVYTITKSDVSNMFAVAISFSNLTSTVSKNTSSNVERADVWSASNLYFFANCYAAVGNDCDVIIDSIKVETAEPSAAPTGVAAVWPGANVIVSWDHMPGAATYDVYRSTTSGSYGAAIATGVTADSYIDTSVIDGTIYYYVVQANYYNGKSGDSTEVSPQKIYIGEAFADIEFTAAEGYVDGDLAGQQEWAALADSGSNAFNVITASELADSVSSYGNHDTVNGNAVYLNKLIRNNEDDALKGYIDVIVTAGTPAAGHTDFANQSIMTFGMTSSTTQNHPLWGGASLALFNLNVRSGGDLHILLEDPGTDDDSKRMARLTPGELGWDPKLGADRETDTIRIFFELRKTRDEGVYQAWASMSNLTTGASSENNTYTTVLYSLEAKDDLYNAEYGYFTCGIHPRALFEKTSETNGPVHTAIDRVNLSQTTNNLPVAAAPVFSSVVAADRTIILSWEDVLDSTGYDVLMTSGGEDYTVATNVQKEILGTVEFVDSPRWNFVTNTYTVRALFDSDVTPTSMDSDPTNAVPQSLVKIVDMDGSRADLTDSTSSTFYLSRDGAVTNAVADISYLDRRGAVPMIANGEVSGGVTYNGYTIYGLTQSTSTNGIAYRHFIDNADGGQRYYLSGGWNATAPRQLAYIEIDDMDWDGAPPASIDATTQLLTIYLGLVSYTDGNAGYLYPAIRNGTQWYVGATGVKFNEGGKGAKDIRVSDVMAETWNELNPQVDVLMSAGSALGDNSVLTDVNAVGWFAYQASYMCLSKFEVNASGSTTSYEYWTGTYGLIGDDAELSADPDGDGIINEQEFAFDGNPTNQNTAILPVFDATPTSYMGEDGYIYTYIKSRDPVSGLVYDLKISDDLVNGTWTSSGPVVIGVEKVDYHWEAVTNFIPSTGSKTFLKINL